LETGKNLSDLARPRGWGRLLLKGLRDLTASISSDFWKDKTLLVTRLGIILYVLTSVIYLGFGQLNNDEGWYLYASKLVYQGALPYRDFAYPQMPLLPYIYGVLQILNPSLFLGRLTSVIISIGAFGMGLVLARRYAGARAGALAALLFAASTFDIYFNSITKTYALVSFCFTATLLVLSSDLQANWKYPLALLYTFLAVLVRITALFFAIPVFLYVLVVAPRRARVWTVLEGVGTSLLAGFFLLPDWPAARWNLFASHLSHWGGVPLFDQIREIITVRLPDLTQTFGPALVLGIASLYFLWQNRDRKAWPRDPLPLVVATVGLVLFAASHLANGIWSVEYVVPAVTVLIPILAIVLSRPYAESGRTARTFLQGVLLAVLLLLPLGESTQHTDLTGGRLPLSEVDQVAAFVAQNSQPDGQVLALEAFAVVVDAHRPALPGMTLSQFSLQPVDTATAQQLHVVNSQMVLDAINRTAAPVVLLTNQDWNDLAAADAANQSAIQRALEQNYRVALVMPNFGQFDHTLYVYLVR
jgi:hypothetical protein